MPTFANDFPFDFKKLKQSITGIMMVVLLIYILSYSLVWERMAICIVLTKMLMQKKISWPMIDLPSSVATLDISANGCATIKLRRLTGSWPI